METLYPQDTTLVNEFFTPMPPCLRARHRWTTFSTRGYRRSLVGNSRLSLIGYTSPLVDTLDWVHGTLHSLPLQHDTHCLAGMHCHTGSTVQGICIDGTCIEDTCIDGNTLQSLTMCCRVSSLWKDLTDDEADDKSTPGIQSIRFSPAISRGRRL